MLAFAAYLQSNIQHVMCICMQVHRVLKLLESPYDPIPPEEETETEKSLQTREESEATNVKTNSAQTVDPLDSYFSKPPKWSLGLCVT